MYDAIVLINDLLIPLDESCNAGFELMRERYADALPSACVTSILKKRLKGAGGLMMDVRM